MYQCIDEVAKLRKELRDTLVTYDKACIDLVHAKKQIHVLSIECSEEARKIENALEWEEALKRVVADEKARQVVAINQVEQARESFTREAYSRHKTAMATSMTSKDKADMVDAILSKSRSCRRYSQRDIELATDNFSEARKIGEGGYGNVYRCNLDHAEVAAKVLQQDSTDKTEEFLKEVEILSQLRHPNLVLLLGFCPEISCLAYEYMENGSLEDQLFTSTGRPLHWFLRLRIIFEVSCGLAFLHARSPAPVVHRDLKPANILLDRNFVAKVGDVGFAKLTPDPAPDWRTEYKATSVAGTLYYMDPEYQRTGTLRPKSDVFALGVIILQLLTGGRPDGLTAAAEDAVANGRVGDIVDESQLADWPVSEAEALAKLGLRCAALRCRDRPDLESEVLPELDEMLHRITTASAAVSLRGLKPSVPSHFICPITQELMEDPHVAADGHTYEHCAIRAWLGRHKTSPVTRRRLPSSSVIPNHSLRAAIVQWESQK